MNLQLRLNLQLARLRLYSAQANNRYSTQAALKLITN